MASGILVNAVAPGPIATDMTSPTSMSPEQIAMDLTSPLARYGHPDDIAAMVRFLSDSEAGFITGHCFGANGGSAMPRAALAPVSGAVLGRARRITAVCTERALNRVTLWHHRLIKRLTRRDGMTATIHDIARSMGVSIATVSNALSGKGRVSEALKSRIRHEADRQGYAPSPSARALRTGRSGVIGLVLPDIANPLFPALAQAIEAEAQARGQGVLIADSRGTNEAQDAALDRLVRQGADALVLVPRRGTRVPTLGVPMAVIDATSNPANSICADHIAGGRLVIAHLRAQGHARILLVGQSPSSHVQTDRIAGMTHATGGDTPVHWLDDAPLPPPETLAAQGITAIATTSDLIALPLLTRLQAAGLRLPRDMAVTGFDNHAFSALVAPGLTTVAQDLRAIASGALGRLAAQLDSHPALPPRTVPVQLLRRGSTTTHPDTTHPDKETPA
ncbi:SDR family oxidoreductase [Salipiger aestuarii]|nr:SDR family oxidoreductase [Salipiger aestuarii]